MPKTLLLADDSVTIQKVVGISFANEDVRIVTVDNGDDAVIRAREVKPDIVLADVVMPGKSGYDVCAAIKADAELRGVPVLLLTGTFETFDEDRAARVGADGHITKPFEAQALVELVNARLAAASSARSARPGAAAVQPRAQAEPEPFDFLEPEEATLPRRGQSAPPVASARDEDAFAFEAEPLDGVELETEDESDLELGNEVTEARTALLI
ncbi:MAG: response regulator, partial [Myxococcota bacterium]